MSPKTITCLHECCVLLLRCYYCSYFVQQVVRSQIVLPLFSSWSLAACSFF